MTITSLRPWHQSTANVNERWRWSSIGMIVSRFRGILSPIFNRQRHNRSDHFSKGQGESSRSSQSQGRKVADTNTGIVLTEHTLDGTVCKSYSGLEPQISPQDSTTSNINIYAEPQAKYQDEVPAIALLSQLAGMIKKRDWNQLVAELRAHEHEELNEGVGKGLLLHLALRCYAPLHIITQLTHGIQTSASHRDARGRLPLHVAIRKVSQLSIVSHVLMLNPRACISLDDQGNTPLHICFDEDVMNAFKPSQFRELVRTLIHEFFLRLLLRNRYFYVVRNLNKAHVI